MIFVIIFIALIITAIIILIAASKKIYPPESKGEQGENRVAQILGDTIVGEQYVINNLLFCINPEKSCQIDHVFINKFGIWVIETKNYAGCIYGDENKREWTQALASGNKTHTFYNPIKQNATHIYHLSKYLNVKNIFQNVIVFLSRADISNISSENVYSVDELTTIKTKNTVTYLSVEKMEYYYNLLLTLKNNSTISEKVHIENIYRMQAQIQQGICPRCGGKLVIKNGKYGQFYGCSNYPKCKFHKNAD